MHLERPTRDHAGAALPLLVALGGVPLALGCEPAATDEPTWAADVRPILAANCVRCHGVPAIGGAPPWFRLDVYEDTVLDDGRILRGAGSMSEFVFLRTSDETMPPTASPDLAAYQIETLKNWAALRPDNDLGYKGRPPKGEREGDGDPVMALTDAERVEDEIVFRYELRDPDRDIVSGTLLVTPEALPDDPIEVTALLHAGRDEVRWDTRAIDDGTWIVTAWIDDGDGAIEVELGTTTVSHGANTAPLVSIVAPGRDTIISDLDSPFAVQIEATDRDGDAITLDVHAVSDAEDVAIALDVPATGPTTSVDWDTTDLAEGARWRLEVTASDGTATRTARSPSLVISHGATTELYGAPDASCDGAAPPIGCVLAIRCGWCHDGPYVPELQLRLTSYQVDPDDPDDPGGYGAYPARGRIYNRVFLEGNMPPVSALQLGVDPLTLEERSRIEDWLLGGAPE